jgi:hypothetical protein
MGVNFFLCKKNFKFTFSNCVDILGRLSPEFFSSKILRPEKSANLMKKYEQYRNFFVLRKTYLGFAILSLGFAMFSLNLAIYPKILPYCP